MAFFEIYGNFYFFFNFPKIDWRKKRQWKKLKILYLFYRKWNQPVTTAFQFFRIRKFLWVKTFTAEMSFGVGNCENSSAPGSQTRLDRQKFPTKLDQQFLCLPSWIGSRIFVKQNNKNFNIFVYSWPNHFRCLYLYSIASSFEWEQVSPAPSLRVSSVLRPLHTPKSDSYATS